VGRLWLLLASLGIQSQAGAVCGIFRDSSGVSDGLALELGMIPDVFGAPSLAMMPLTQYLMLVLIRRISDIRYINSEAKMRLKPSLHIHTRLCTFLALCGCTASPSRQSRDVQMLH